MIQFPVPVCRSHQGLLATYLIPGCVGRGVRLGSESPSGGANAGGFWKSGNLGTWKSGNLEIWGRGNPGIRSSGDLEIQKFGVRKIKIMKILKIQIHSAQDVGKVWISRGNSSWPHLGPSQAIVPWTKKSKNMLNRLIFLGGPMGPSHPVWVLAAIHPGWGNR